MYSQRKVQARLETAQRELNQSLTYHTVPEIDEFNEHLQHSGMLTFDDHGLAIGTRNLTAYESQFILNERALVMCDHAYALTRYCYIKDEQNMIRRFAFRVAQKILFEVISDLEDMEAAIQLLILKARQLGMSTVVELLIMLRITMGYGINAVVASADVEKSGLMSSMLFLAYDALPVWLRPRFTARAEQGDQRKLIFGSLSTSLSIQHGNKMKGGIARGWTPTIYHLSECASFTNPGEQIEDALLKAVHESPSVFGVLESTGEGDIGWWPDTWRQAKANWGGGRAKFFPQFFPWAVGIDIYPTPTWIRIRPVPSDWQPLPDTREHVAKVEAYINSQELLRKYLVPTRVPHLTMRHEGTHYQMPIEQQWFWEVGHEEHKAKGREGKWYQEMAGDDIEALQRSAESVFGHDTIIEVDTRRERGYKVYGLSGQSIETQHEPDPDTVDYHADRLLVRYRNRRSEDSFRWEFIPLKHDEQSISQWQRTNSDAFLDYSHGKLFVFHEPRPGIDYSIGVDTSGGRGHDSTVISVCAVGQRGGPDEQVAEFRSAYVSHVEAYAFVIAIAAYYSKWMPDTCQHPEPLVGIEQLAAVGDTCQLQMRKMGYSRFPSFVRYDSKNINPAKSPKLGWYTTGWSRPILIDGFIHSIRNGWYKLNSPWTIDECAHFEVHYTASGKEKKEHSEISNDDGIFAAAISTHIPHHLEAMTNRTEKKYMGPDVNGLPPLDPRPRGSFYVRNISQLPQPLSLDDITQL